MTILKVKIDDFEFDFEPNDVLAMDFFLRSDHELHLLIENISHHATIIEDGSNYKNGKIRLDGNTFKFEISDQIDQQTHKMGFDKPATRQLKMIIAPMPGLVLDILVKKGDQVNAGDPLIILEAMKMENVIKIQMQATIDEIFVKKGNSVDKGQILIKMK